MKYQIQFKQSMKTVQVVQAVVEVDDPADIPNRIEDGEFLKYLVVQHINPEFEHLKDEPIVMKVLNEES